MLPGRTRHAVSGRRASIYRAFPGMSSARAVRGSTNKFLYAADYHVFIVYASISGALHITVAEQAHYFASAPGSEAACFSGPAYPEGDNMRTSNKKLTPCFVAIMLGVFAAAFVSSASAEYMYDQAEQPTAGTMLADTVLVRPLMLVGTAAGVVAFVVTLPFSALGGNVGDAGRLLVVDPAKYTFVRPLGEF
jgi:hypothetical protein